MMPLSILFGHDGWHRASLSLLVGWRDSTPTGWPILNRIFYLSITLLIADVPHLLTHSSPPAHCNHYLDDKPEWADLRHGEAAAPREQERWPSQNRPDHDSQTAARSAAHVALA